MISALYFSPCARKCFTASSRGSSRRFTGRSAFASSAIRASMARQVFGGEGSRIGEVIEEAVLDHRTDGDLGFGEQLLDGLRQQVRSGVTDHLEGSRILVGDDGKLRVLARW